MKILYIGDEFGKNIVTSMLEDYGTISEITECPEPDITLVSSLYSEALKFPEDSYVLILNDNPHRRNNPSKLISYHTLNEILNELDKKEILFTAQEIPAFLNLPRTH